MVVVTTARAKGVFLSLIFVAATAGAQSIPTDAKATCTVTAAVFATWFQSGHPSLNGVVNPANSVTFPNTPNCSFYQWSKQMFLWLTSPAPETYGGGGGIILNSPAFYDVSPPEPPTPSGVRTFIPHEAGILRPFPVRVAQVGPHGLPVLFDTRGRMVEVEPTPVAPSGKQLIRTTTGALAEVEKVTVANGKASFLDAAGKAIPQLRATAAKAVVRTPMANIVTVQKFIVNGIPIFIDPTGSVITVEQGQADGGVLETQSGSLIYFATMVNDVYAYFLTGTKDGGITPAPTQFPTTAADLAKITAFASAHGKTFPDPDALAVEVKSSWVAAAGLPNLSSYVTMNATVPTYDKSNPSLWKVNGQQNIELAMVGMHVVGSTAGHPEMIWATFEHVGNAPDAAYSYINTSNATKSVPQNTSGTWLFTASGSSGPFNQMHMNQVSGTTNIAPLSPFTISPSNTIRWKAWGGASNVSPNPLDPTTAASNTEIISIHNSIAAMMPAGDVRNNYVMKGATWTIFGALPSTGNQVGTSMLANTTMETYEQGSDTTNGGGSTNCFTCHSSGTFLGLSHVFGGATTGLKPLF